VKRRCAYSSERYRNREGRVRRKEGGKKMKKSKIKNKIRKK
jgi:hypothetical protein